MEQIYEGDEIYLSGTYGDGSPYTFTGIVVYMAEDFDHNMAVGKVTSGSVTLRRTLMFKDSDHPLLLRRGKYDFESLIEDNLEG